MSALHEKLTEERRQAAEVVRHREEDLRLARLEVTQLEVS
jgi:hypothetical protein